MSIKAIFSFALLAVAGTVSAEGINCEGSSNCILQGDSDVLKYIYGEIAILDPVQYFNAGGKLARSIRACRTIASLQYADTKSFQIT